MRTQCDAPRVCDTTVEANILLFIAFMKMSLLDEARRTVCLFGHTIYIQCPSETEQDLFLAILSATGDPRSNRRNQKCTRYSRYRERDLHLSPIP